MRTSSAWEAPVNFAEIHTHVTSRACVGHRATRLNSRIYRNYVIVYRPCSTMCVDGNQVSRICTHLLSRSKHPWSAKTRWKESEFSSTSSKRKFLQQNRNKLRCIVGGRSVSKRRLEFERNCNPSKMESMFLVMFLAKNRWKIACRFSCILYRR